jgi:hypothetical protein
MPEWVKVTERLPQNQTRVWASVGQGVRFVMQALYWPNRKRWEGSPWRMVQDPEQEFPYSPTHWMPFDVPEPPEEGEP